MVSYAFCKERHLWRTWIKFCTFWLVIVGRKGIKSVWTLPCFMSTHRGDICKQPWASCSPPHWNQTHCTPFGVHQALKGGADLNASASACRWAFMSVNHMTRAAQSCLCWCALSSVVVDTSHACSRRSCSLIHCRRWTVLFFSLGICVTSLMLAFGIFWEAGKVKHLLDLSLFILSKWQWNEENCFKGTQVEIRDRSEQTRDRRMNNLCRELLKKKLGSCAPQLFLQVASFPSKAEEV